MAEHSLSHSFRCALAGLVHVVKTERNAKIHVAAAVAAAVLGVALHISYTDWAILALTIGSVLALEMVNTALEAVVDLATTENRPLAKAAKDAAAAGVLVAAVASVAVGLAIFGPAL